MNKTETVSKTKFLWLVLTIINISVLISSTAVTLKIYSAVGLTMDITFSTVVSWIECFILAIFSIMLVKQDKIENFKKKTIFICYAFIALGSINIISTIYYLNSVGISYIIGSIFSILQDAFIICSFVLCTKCLYAKKDSDEIKKEPVKLKTSKYKAPFIFVSVCFFIISFASIYVPLFFETDFFIPGYMNFIIGILIFLCIELLPVHILTPNDAPRIKKSSLKKAVVALVIIALYICSTSTSSGGNTATCKSCGRTFSAGDDAGNYKNIASSGMCNNCEGNYHSLEDYIGK